LLDNLPTCMSDLIEREQMVGELRTLKLTCNWFENRHEEVLTQMKQNEEDND